MACLSIHTLGAFHVTLDGEPVAAFESNKVRALLVYLAIEADRPHSRDTLIGFLWPDQPEQAARRNLSQALFNLRQVIGDEKADPPFLCVTRQTVQFNRDSNHWLDVAEFGKQVATSIGKSAEVAAGCLQSAADLYLGEFLAGFFVDDSLPFSEWASLLRERLHHQALDALYRLAHYHEQRRDYQRARQYAQRQVELEPWREEAHQQLMRLLARTGQRSAALHQYETCRRVLADELGVEPAEDTRHLYRRIKLVPELGAHNLPPQVTPFVGRETELSELGERLVSPTCRLVTLVGPGGIGKTRLAIQAAWENRTAFLDGVCFVPLAGLESAEFLAPAIADALQAHFEGPTPPQTQLLDSLRERDLLLVLDNLEHLIKDGAWLLADILQAAPEVTLLVTSRERLNLYAETVFVVKGLEFPGEAEGEHTMGYSAVDLFLRSADRAQAGFALAPPVEEMAGIVHICCLVEGMPLGIELAAAWTHTFSCREIASQIEEGLAFLSTSARDVLPRHRSLQAAFDHSWQRLPAEDQRVFARLSVFRGGFDREAAQQVAGASPQSLSSLIDRSFLTRTPAGRYTLHELMRQYGADKLAQDPQQAICTRDDHCGYYGRLIGEQFERFQGGQQRQALSTIQTEIDNVRAAWQRAVDQSRYRDIEGLMNGLHVYALAGYGSGQEATALFGKALPVLERTVAGQPCGEEETLCLLGKLLWRQGQLLRELETPDDRPANEALLQRSVALLRGCGDKAELSRALGVLGNFLRKGGRSVEGRPLLEESLDLARQVEDRTHLAEALDNLGHILGPMGERDKGQQLLLESLAIHRECNHLLGMGHNLNNLGSLAYRAGDYAAAKEWFLQSKAVFEELGSPGLPAMTIHNVGAACQELGEYEESARHHLDALRRSTSGFASRLPLNTILGLAELAEKLGQHLHAYELATFVIHHPLTELSIYEGAGALLGELKPQLSPAAAAAAEGRARTWTLNDVVAELLAPSGD